MGLRILYEDAELLLCVKPAGLVSEESGVPRVLREQGAAASLYCVHRLDRPVGGLMVYAKTSRAAAALSVQIADGRFEKRYLAVVQGSPAPSGSMRDMLFKDSARNKSYVVKRMRRGVREASLEYETLERQGSCSLVRVRLLTGRSHQIRVQFASRKMPLLGDRSYGSSIRDCGLALWSEQLKFQHPVSGEALCFRAAPPPVCPWTEFQILQGEPTCDTSK